MRHLNSVMPCYQQGPRIEQECGDRVMETNLGRWVDDSSNKRLPFFNHFFTLLSIFLDPRVRQEVAGSNPMYHMRAYFIQKIACADLILCLKFFKVLAI